MLLRAIRKPNPRLAHSIVLHPVQRDIGSIIIFDEGVIGDGVIADQQGPTPLVRCIPVRAVQGIAMKEEPIARLQQDIDDLMARQDAMGVLEFLEARGF